MKMLDALKENPDQRVKLAYDVLPWEAEALKELLDLQDAAAHGELGDAISEEDNDDLQRAWRLLSDESAPASIEELSQWSDRFDNIPSSDGELGESV